jgi:hypothetical protein
MEADANVDSVINKLTKKEKQNPLIDDNGDGIGHGSGDPDVLPIGEDGIKALNTFP